MNYLPRLVHSQIEQALSAVGSVLIEGPRYCGKTSTGIHFSKSTLRLDTDPGMQKLAEIAPLEVLQGESPRLIDEWQLAPNLWNQVRRLADENQTAGQFILTGSAFGYADTNRHSGAGRIMRVKMRPMSLFESGKSTGENSIEVLFSGAAAKPGVANIGFTEIVDEICRGGWPALRETKLEAALAVMRSYLDDVARSDFVDEGRKSTQKRIIRVLKALARNTGSEISTAKLAEEITERDDDKIKPATLENYLDKLRKVMVIEEAEPWVTHLRSQYLVRKSSKRYFVDPSLAVAALRATPNKLRKDLNTLGFLFENLVIRDLRIYAQRLNGEVLHYRDESGREVDAIIVLDDGRWGAIEIKLGEKSVDDAATNLKDFVDRIDTSKTGEPAFLAVVNADKVSYQRPDGVAVIAAGSLGP